MPAGTLSTACGRFSRRTFLSDCGMGFTGLAIGSMLASDGVSRAESNWSPPTGLPHFAPKAKSVIWLFMLGGASHLETFDPKPELNKHAGKTIAESPHKDVLTNKYVKNSREVAIFDRKIRSTLYPLQVGFKKYGQSGMDVSDWLPNIGSCADDLCLVRSAWTTDTDHAAILQFHTGRHMLDGPSPSIGSWVRYGLGSLNDNLPQFVVLGEPELANCSGSHLSNYLGPEYDGVRINADPTNPLPFVKPGAGVSPRDHASKFGLLKRLHGLRAVEYPEDDKLRARIKSYELAFGMQAAVPEVFAFDSESKETKSLYGLDEPVTEPFARLCVSARRLVERGVRFVQVYHGEGNKILWDNHTGLKAGHSKLCSQVDRPIAGLIKDLKRRGLLDETLVVWCTEFGRSPGIENGDGRDHHPWAMSIFMAGGGIKRGVTYGATDEIGFHAVENRHYVTDVHATILHQLGLDSRRLEVPGRKRLEIDHGSPIQGIIA